MKNLIFFNLRLLRDYNDNFFNETAEDIKKLYDGIYETDVDINIIIEFIKLNTNEYIDNKRNIFTEN
jgi:hypothetical protein